MLALQTGSAGRQAAVPEASLAVDLPGVSPVFFSNSAVAPVESW